MSERRIDSSDDHLDINAMPADAWVARLPEKYREGGPRVVERDGNTFDRGCDTSYLGDKE